MCQEKNHRVADSEFRDRWRVFSGAGPGIPKDHNLGSAPVPRTGDEGQGPLCGNRQRPIGVFCKADDFDAVVGIDEKVLKASRSEFYEMKFENFSVYAPLWFCIPPRRRPQVRRQVCGVGTEARGYFASVVSDRPPLFPQPFFGLKTSRL